MQETAHASGNYPEILLTDLTAVWFRTGVAYLHRQSLVAFLANPEVVPARGADPVPLPSPKTVGEHIKYERMRRGMRQKDLVTWEKHGVEPSAKVIPAIIEWLGYDPFPAGETFGERLACRR